MPFDNDYFTDPYSLFAQLRDASPVHRVKTPDGHPIWLVTREADVRAALTDPRLALNKIYSRGGYAGFALPQALDANLLNRDGADHARLRRLASEAFTPRRVEALRTRIHSIAGDLADAIAERGQADLVADYAAPLPLAVIGELLAIPPANRQPFAHWTTTMLTPTHPSHVGESATAIHQFISELITARRAEPGDDLLSAWITARDHHDRLDEHELLSLTFLILWAGIENVTHLISNGTLSLLRHPDHAQALRTNQHAVATAVEELLRYASPDLVSIRRFATEDIQIAGVRIPAGDTVMLALASANRDPARFPNPNKLNTSRTTNPHLALGHGPHYCLGAPLARMELTIAFTTLLHRFPNLTLAQPETELRWRPSFRSHGLLTLPVTV